MDALLFRAGPGTAGNSRSPVPHFVLAVTTTAEVRNWRSGEPEGELAGLLATVRRLLRGTDPHGPAETEESYPCGRLGAQLTLVVQRLPGDVLLGTALRGRQPAAAGHDEDLLDELPPDSRRLVQALAVLGGPVSYARLGTLLKNPDDLARILQPALDARLVRWHARSGAATAEERLRPQITAGMSPAERLAAHAWAQHWSHGADNLLHRAAAARHPLPGLADELEQEAYSLGRVGHFANAARLLRHAADLSSDATTAARRQLDSVEFRLRAHHTRAARRELDSIRRQPPSARHLLLAGRLSVLEGDLRQGLARLAEAHEHAAADDLRAESEGRTNTGSAGRAALWLAQARWLAGLPSDLIRPLLKEYASSATEFSSSASADDAIAKMSAAEGPLTKTLSADEQCADAPSADELDPNDPSPQDLSTQDLSPQDLSPQDLSTQHPSTPDLSEKDLSAQDPSEKDSYWAGLHTWLETVLTARDEGPAVALGIAGTGSRSGGPAAPVRRRTLLTEAWLSLEAGELDRCERALHNALDLEAGSPDSAPTGLPHMLLGHLHWLRGDWSLAQLYARMATRSATGLWRPTAAPLGELIAASRGQMPALEKRLPGSHQRTALSGWLAGFARVVGAVEAGDTGRAARVIGASLHTAEPPEQTVPLMTWRDIELLRAAALVANDAAMERARAGLRRLHATTGTPWSGLFGSWGEALVAAHAGNREEALDRYRDAEDHADRLPSEVPWYHARLLADHAALLASTGKRRAALDRYRSAHETASRLEAHPLLARCAEGLAGLRLPRSARGYRLTQRESDVARLVASGLTNKETATRLFVTPASIAFHLSNIYAKTGVHNRYELRTWWQSLDETI
ncbi:LuxR C-terminal-related transcriptional regulator [Streptomyces sp. NPDC091376]|uniref:helix-turn-helix transcriptional regulator n=1 Tax=Streptomyces sp. NPDC091376 TaxID=3365994 RepID=UPI00381E07E7